MVIFSVTTQMASVPFLEVSELFLEQGNALFRERLVHEYLRNYRSKTT